MSCAVSVSSNPPEIADCTMLSKVISMSSPVKTEEPTVETTELTAADKAAAEEPLRFKRAATSLPIPAPPKKEPAAICIPIFT